MLALVVPHAAADTLKLTHQGVERTAVLLRPGAGADGPMPLIVALHGLGGSGENFSKWQLFEPLA